MKRHFFISILLLIACTLSTIAQNVSGYVFDAKDGEPIVGATVLCGTLGCITNVDGYFSLKASPGSKITVKYIGMKTKTVYASSNMQIAMGKGPYQLIKRVPSASKTNNLSQSYSAKKSEPDNQASNVMRTQKTDEKTGQSWTEIKKGYKYGVEVNGKMVVPCEYGWVGSSYGYFRCSNYSPKGEALYQRDGKCIVPLSKGYSSVWVNENDGMRYIHIGRGNVCGSLDLQGREMVPISMGYEHIWWEKVKGKIYAHVGKGNVWGIYDISAAKELVPITRGYSNVVMHNGSYIGVTKNGKAGACDMYGKEIIAPAYDNLFLSSNEFNYKNSSGKYVGLGIDANGNRISTSSSSSSSGSYSSSGTSSSSSSSYSSSSSSYSSSSSSSSNSQYGRLLFQGTYTLTGMVRNGLSVTATGQPALQKMTIYEKYMIPEGMKTLPYRGNTTIYGETGRKYGLNDDMFFLVTSNGLVRLISVFRVTMPIVGNVEDVKMAYYDIGDTRAAYAGRVLGGNNPVNSYNGGTVNSGGSVNTPNRQRNCNHCHGTGWCPTCNHTGWVVNRYSKGQSPCPNCNPNGERVFNPNRGKCPLCGGTGKR